MKSVFRGLLAVAVLSGLCWSAPAFGAGPLEAIFQKVERAPWGAKSAAVKKELASPPLRTDKGILLVDDKGLSGRSTLSYLFDQNGALYNLAWYTVTPVSDIKAAQSLEKSLEKALRAKYGKPLTSHVDGSPGGARGVAKKQAQREKAAKILEEAKAAKGSALTGPEIIKAMEGTGASMGDIMPTLFYSKLNFWDGGQVWVVSNLLCSNDGSCYQHLQFASKEQTQKGPEAYRPTPEKLFSYTPLDRDQDTVTRNNRSLKR